MSESMTEEHFQTFCRQMLKTRVFNGLYKERKRVDKLNDYRDVIIIDKNEMDLIEALKNLKIRMLIRYQNQCINNNNLWIGITVPDDYDKSLPLTDIENDYCIWTKLYNVPFGEHKFYIKTIKFHNNEIIIKLECIIEDESKKAKNKRPTPNKQKSNDNDNDDSNTNDNNLTQTTFASILSKWQNDIKTSLLTILANDVNTKNLMSVIKFIGMLIAALFVFSTEAIKYIGSYTLKFMIECRLWVQTFTPIILKLIDCLMKIIGGLFILIAMIIKNLFGYNSGSNEIVGLNMLTPSSPPRMLEYHQPRISGTRRFNYHYN